MERLEEPWELTDPTPATCILLPSGTDHRDRTPPSTCYMQRQGRRWVPFASGWDSPPWTMDCYPVASGWKPLQIHIFLAANTRQAPMEVHPPPLIWSNFRQLNRWHRCTTWLLMIFLIILDQLGWDWDSFSPGSFKKHIRNAPQNRGPPIDWQWSQLSDSPDWQLCNQPHQPCDTQRFFLPHQPLVWLSSHNTTSGVM